MRIFPMVLITLGVFGVLKHLGLIDPAFVHLFWPILLIAVGVAMLVRGPRWRERLYGDRWERRMHRHFGPGWANLSEAERERFRAGMRAWQGPCGDPSGAGSAPSATAPASQGSAPGEQR